MKITKDKMKAIVKYEHKYGTDADLKVITGKDGYGYSIVKVKPHGDGWCISKDEPMLTLQETGSGFVINVTPDDWGQENKTIVLDYGDAHNLLVALLTELSVRHHKIDFEWYKVTEEFAKGEKQA